MKRENEYFKSINTNVAEEKKKMEVSDVEVRKQISKLEDHVKKEKKVNESLREEIEKHKNHA